MQLYKVWHLTFSGKGIRFSLWVPILTMWGWASSWWRVPRQPKRVARLPGCAGVQRVLEFNSFSFHFRTHSRQVLWCGFTLRRHQQPWWQGAWGSPSVIRWADTSEQKIKIDFQKICMPVVPSPCVHRWPTLAASWDYSWGWAWSASWKSWSGCCGPFWPSSGETLEAKKDIAWKPCKMQIRNGAPLKFYCSTRIFTIFNSYIKVVGMFHLCMILAHDILQCVSCLLLSTCVS